MNAGEAMTITRYPLSWPAGWRRTPSALRRRARFNKKERQHGATGEFLYARSSDLTVSQATERVLGELFALGVSQKNETMIISTNLKVRLDGLPRSDQSAPADPGAAVYWERKGKRQVMAIDQYDRVADNLAAIAATLEAMRAIERHGGAQILERAFTGFDQLPEPNNWRHVLGLTTETATMDKAEAAYKKLAMARHPDRGGTHEQMAAINAAWDQAKREFQAD